MTTTDSIEHHHPQVNARTMTKDGFKLPRRSPVALRLLERIELQDDGCWRWTGPLTDGYGRIQVGGRGGEKVSAHRVAYEAWVGPIPNGLHLDHLCRNRACLNPAHMEPVSNHENILRGIASGNNHGSRRRREDTHCKHGHEYDNENTCWFYRRGRGAWQRQCRRCVRDASRRYVARKAAR